jgi:hypothetical protein
MNRDDIIRMAREAQMSPSADGMYWTATLSDLEKFAAAERESCAQLAEGWQYLPENNFSKAQIAENMCKTIAHYIRARGQA